jgi:transcriptional antiterminator NusG
MSVQDPQDRFEQDSVKDEMEEVEDSSINSTLSDSASSVQTNDAESVDIPADESPITDEESAPADETERPEVPAIEELPLSSSDELPPPEPAEGPAWYVIHCYSGYENKVRHNLEQRIETMGMKDKIFDVVIPTQEEIEVKDGKRRTVERHIFPGYVLVNMLLTEESWYVVRNTPGVTGFVGMGNNPTPLRPEEVAQIVKRMEAEAPTVKVTFKVGERVRIIDGPFNDFRGVVSEIDMERTKVRVMVSFFGRETPVELDFLQVEKA